mmetsp:Transcript_12543/g.40008  ORF Transcript_12543/g.40008 Transcript_12543/m.40008 type:complete len:109 (-) Transcript_12543:698-1024(-)
MCSRCRAELAIPCDRVRMLNPDTADSLRMVKTCGVWSVCEGAFACPFRLANNTKRSNMKSRVGAPMVILAPASTGAAPAAPAAGKWGGERGERGSDMAAQSRDCHPTR